MARHLRLLRPQRHTAERIFAILHRRLRQEAPRRMAATGEEGRSEGRHHGEVLMAVLVLRHDGLQLRPAVRPQPCAGGRVQGEHRYRERLYDGV